LHHDLADGVEAGTARTSGGLMELTGTQTTYTHTVVVARRGEQHRTERAVHSHRQGVGAADDLEQPCLGQALDQATILRQHARVMYPDAVPYVSGQVAAELGGEAEGADLLGDPGLLLPGAHVDTGQRLGPLDRLCLGEMHDV